MTVKFVKNFFTTDYKKTLGVDFLMKEKYVKSIDRNVSFYIWDTAGQDYYDSITRRYYTGADAALVVFSLTDKNSFDSVKKWVGKVRTECDDIPIALVMSKIDLLEQAVISDKMAVELAKEVGLNLYKVSSKDNVMVNEVFEVLAVEHFKKGEIHIMIIL
jgi:Ras-related protein Rab-23